MAGQARRGTRGQGRSSRGDSSWPVLAAASVGASGSATDTLTTEPSPEMQAAPPIQATYRNLLLKGMAPEEAANLTAFIAGIPIGDTRSEERRVGKECSLLCRSRWSPYH